MREEGLPASNGVAFGPRWGQMPRADIRALFRIWGKGPRCFPVSAAWHNPCAVVLNMLRHWKGLITLFAAMVLAFSGAVFAHSIGVGLIILVVGLVAAFVLGTAWMRPAGTTEHHPPHDRIMNDTNP